MDSKTDKLGETREMNCGEYCRVIKYRNARDIDVMFLKTKEIVKCEYNQFLKGRVKSHYVPTVRGFGITGTEVIRDCNGKYLRSYVVWKHIINRCYNKDVQTKQPSYINCSICDEWRYYKNFKIWYNDNYYTVNDEKMCIDKDILIKGNKIYSPQTCIFVPNDINVLFTNSRSARGVLPVGVSYYKRYDKYNANLRFNGKYKNLGYFETVEEAFKAYKDYKERYIKIVADKYKGVIPTKLYEAMYMWEVSIND